jgi:hypothetical protein
MKKDKPAEKLKKEECNSITLDRRKFIGIASGVGVAAGMKAVFGVDSAFAQQQPPQTPPPPVKTNFDTVKDLPKTKYSLPGLFPGKVIEVEHSKCWKGPDEADTAVVREMVDRGMKELTGKEGIEAWRLFIEPSDIVGIKVNPAGEKIMSPRYELVDVVIENLVKTGVPKKNIIIWDRFSDMLDSAGYTKERYPDVEIAGLQIMDESIKAGQKVVDGQHVSKDNFDMDVYYWADVDGPEDIEYLKQHVFIKKYSYFGKLITKRLTRIINLSVLKNSGNGISQATKNIAYGVIANTGRLHAPIGYGLNTEVLGFPCVRDKLVLNILDGIKGQYEGGPAANAKYIYIANKLFFATDPFAQDSVGFKEILEKRKTDPTIKINDSPRYTEYLRTAQKVGLGITDPGKIEHKKIVLG